MSMLRRGLVAAGCAVAVAGAGVMMLPANADPPASSLPPAAIAVGDSFISGEGAGDYRTVRNLSGTVSDFPGWDASNSDAFFCHRSSNASILQADLPDTPSRFNLACSGAQPQDLVRPSAMRDKGRRVASQLYQLRQVAMTHDIDLVQVGLGSNTSQYTFGAAAATCAERFVSDAWIGWWEVWVPIKMALDGKPVPKESPCRARDLATAEQLAAGTAETVNALRELMRTLEEVDADGEHRVVLQDYTSPLPEDFDPAFHTEDGRSDTRDKFRELGRERYRAGCPAHRASLHAGHWFAGQLGRVVRSAYTALSEEFPGADLVYLNVQDAFDGARLCENPDSPANTLATPLRGQSSPDGHFEPDLDGWNKSDVKELADTCRGFFQTCQESWHPNAAGHRVLARCLEAAALSPEPMVDCDRRMVRRVGEPEPQEQIRVNTCDEGIELFDGSTARPRGEAESSDRVRPRSSSGRQHGPRPEVGAVNGLPEPPVVTWRCDRPDSSPGRPRPRP